MAAPDGLRVSAFGVPTASPEADGTLEWSRTVLVTVDILREGARGFGYTYADVATARFIGEHFAPLIAAADPESPPAAFATMGRAVRNLGRDGVAATAIAAVDMALWDLKARRHGLALAALLGARRSAVEAYGSGGFTSYAEADLRQHLAHFREAGFRAVKMKIGAGADTLERVAAARNAVGPEVSLFVDANGAYDRRSALATADRLERYDVSWFEEPVSSDDLHGLRFVRDRAPRRMAVAAGEYGYRSVYFERMLDHGAVDVLQADATRCGVTGFLAAATLCEARGVPLSAHCAPTIHAHLGCVAAAMAHVEYFYDHARIEAMLFDGFPAAESGALSFPAERPGLGIEFKRPDAESFLLWDERYGAESRA